MKKQKQKQKQKYIFMFYGLVVGLIYALYFIIERS